MCNGIISVLFYSSEICLDDKNSIEESEKKSSSPRKSSPEYSVIPKRHRMNEV